jgi:uncharacterized protein (TIGR03437 family)
VTADVTALFIGGSVRQGGQASISGRVQADGGPPLSSAGAVHSADGRSLPLATAQPGIFTQDLSRSGQGILVKSDRLTPAEPRTPALRNDVIVLCATGLGPVRPAVRAGEPAPFWPLPTTVNPVTVTIAVG